VKIRVEAEVRPTEDEDKVKAAVLNIITPSNITFEEREGRRLLIAEASNPEALEKLRWRLRLRQILDTARAVMSSSSSGDRVIFYLHKQAAFMGVVTFCTFEEESPLGAIKVEISGANADDVIDWLAPPTFKGKPIFEREPPR